MRSLLIAATVALAACGGSDVPPDAPTDEVASAPAPAPPRHAFDPGALQPGDTVLGLTVVSKDVERALEDSIWVGNVVFEGDLVLQGVYQSHYDWPENTAPCFHVTEAPSIARIPRFPPDQYAAPDMKTWFCFSNPDVAIDVLGSPEQPREAVIALSRYTVVRHLSEVYDEAELSELLEIGAAAERTLIAR